MPTFKTQYSFEKRQTESRLVRLKYPERFPLIIERAKGSKIPDLEKKKYLVNKDMTIGQVVYLIRKFISIESHEAIFLFINGTLPPTAALVSQVFKESCDSDGFLYILYSAESTFG